MKLSFLLGEKAGKFADLEITAVTCDSRNITEGCAFVCINGAVIDGHKFAAEAVEKGAAVIICEKDTGVQNQVFVEDSRVTFAEMCAGWFGEPAKKLKIVGVTGTNGKTSVSYMLKNILEYCGYKVGLIGTIQNMIGDEVLPSKNTTPGAFELQSIFAQMVESGCTYCIMEVSSHALDQNRTYGIEFEIGLFTNLTQDHLDYHITMDNYLNAKKKLFKTSKVAVLNLDDSYYEETRDGIECRTVTYSLFNNEATYTAKNINLRPDGVDFVFSGVGVISRIKTAIGGKFTPYNAMCAASGALELGMPIEKISEAFGVMPGVKGRAEVVPTGKDFTVIIDYAHTPDGLENILKTFAEFEKNRLTVLFGCGGDRDRTKRPKMGAVAAIFADNIIVTSDNPRSEVPEKIIEDILEGMKTCEKPVEVIVNRVEAIKKAIKTAEPGDIIVLAGKGHETYQILSTGTIHLDEREVVAEALAEIQ
ncbi:MAG: UDP-N-acetylmuramoyl-L-alanyl-D-glutamate--2,6-diaminopimelate ligase [Ruminococcaceae bacterium]|nr:UDP-N-acetylmuramoyl-L-alanyl-D-glutamate--2,6-diaminopimelate ligase [Oscillospiraceae bacterium]